jgi:hypothetical protein
LQVIANVFFDGPPHTKEENMKSYGRSPPGRTGKETMTERSQGSPCIYIRRFP